MVDGAYSTGRFLAFQHDFGVRTWDWRTSAVRELADALYEARDFSHMPVLADALQDAGCEDAAILGHCRGPGPHVRGCWVVDLIRGHT